MSCRRSFSFPHILEEKLSDLHIHVYRYGVFRPQGTVQKTSPKFQMKCEMVLCLDSGAACDLRWCPLPSHDLVLIVLLLRICSCLMYFCNSSMMTNDNRRSWESCDCLAELLQDGTFAIYAVSDPSDMISPYHNQSYLVCDISNSFTI